MARAIWEITPLVAVTDRISISHDVQGGHEYVHPNIPFNFTYD